MGKDKKSKFGLGSWKDPSSIITKLRAQVPKPNVSTLFRKKIPHGNVFAPLVRVRMIRAGSIFFAS